MELMASIGTDIAIGGIYPIVFFQMIANINTSSASVPKHIQVGMKKTTNSIKV